MRYEPGDIVQIKSINWYNDNKDKNGVVACGYHNFTEEMSKFCGQTMIIRNITNLGTIYMNGHSHHWTDEMIESLVQRNGQIYPYKIGDRVILKENNKCATITDLEYNSFGNLSYYIKIDNDKDVSIECPTYLLLPYDNNVEGILKEKVDDNKLLVMENKINIAKILKDYPKGTKLYSPLCGECELDYILTKVPDKNSIIGIKYLNNKCIENYMTFNCDGTSFKLENGECLLFPSKDNRDWSKFKVEKPKFDPKTFQLFDKVIVRDGRTKWKCGIFSHINDTKYPFNMECAGCPYTYCIPYNNETKHLIGTTEEAPEFYRYWED